MPEPASPFPMRQSALVWPVAERDKCEIRLREDDVVSSARLDAAARPHLADWLLAIQIAAWDSRRLLSTISKFLSASYGFVEVIIIVIVNS